jgi:hypothetical protein
MLLARLAVPFLLFAALGACAPALDWRELRPEGSGLQLMLPCRPTTQARSVMLAGRSVKFSLVACSAGAQTWALAFADVGDPALVAAALEELRTSAARNLGAQAHAARPLDVPGATPNAGSLRFAVDGRLPDGSAVQEQAAVFVRGTRVFQATAVGAQLGADAVDTFFGSLRFPS